MPCWRPKACAYRPTGSRTAQSIRCRTALSWSTAITARGSTPIPASSRRRCSRRSSRSLPSLAIRRARDWVQTPAVLDSQLPDSTVRASGAAPIFAQDREQEMVLPLAVDLQVGAGITLLLEAGAEQHGAARNIGRQAGGLDAMQPQAVERKIEHQRQGVGHKALARERLADPIAEAGGFGDTAAQVGQADPARQRL